MYAWLGQSMAFCKAVLADILIEPTKTVLLQIKLVLVKVVVVLLILLAGWILSRFIKYLVTNICRFLKLDRLAAKVELDTLLSKGGIRLTLSELAGAMCYWIGLLITLVVGINALGLPIATDLLNRIVLYIPNVVAGVFILVLGIFVATLLRSIVLTAANNAGLLHAKVLAKIVEVVVVVFACMITLEQLNIGARIIEMTISIFLASIGLAFALSFGFGCQDLARKFVQELAERMKSKG